MSKARSIKSSSSRRSIARSSIAPPVVVADLTRDHPSLPDSPGDDPLLLTGPDTYVVYHDQTPSAKNRSTSRVSKAASAQTDISMSMHSHSTPLPAAAAAAVSTQRRDSVASASSSASRGSLYTRMSGKQLADVSAFAAQDDEEADSQRTENVNQANADEIDAQEEDDTGAAYLPYDDAGFASDSDQDEPVAFEDGTSSPVTPPLEAAQLVEEEALEDISSMSDVSRSFADDSAVHERDQISGPVDVSAISASDASGNHDDSAIVEQSLHVGLDGHSIDASLEVSGRDDSDVSEANDQSADADEGEQSVDQSVDQSAADETADVTADITEEVSEELAEPDASIQEPSVDLDDNEESADVSAIDQSVVESANNQTMDASVDDSSAMLSHDEQSQDASTSLDNEDAAVAEEAVADASMLADEEEGTDRANEESRVSDESMDARAADTSAVADTTTGSEVAQDSIEAADDSQAVDDNQEAHEANTLDHEASAQANVSSGTSDKAAEMVGGHSIQDDSRMLGEDSSARRADTSTLPVDSTFGSIDLDVSLSQSEPSRCSHIDGSLLPHPVVLLETLPEDSSAIMAWKAHQAGLDMGVDDDDFTFEIEASVRSREAGDISMADGIRSIAASLATPADEGSAMSRSESIASVLSSLHSADSAEQDDEEEKEEALRRKYQDSREITLNRRANLSRRLSLSTDLEAESDVEEQTSLNGAEQDDDEELQEADASRQRSDASRAESAHSLVEDDQTEEQDDEEEEDSDDNESSLGDDAASSGEEHDDEDADDSDESEDDEDNLGSASEVDSEADESQLDESEQSSSLLEPVVIISSSASPSGASTSALPSEDEEEDGRNTSFKSCAIHAIDLSAPASTASSMTNLRSTRSICDNLPLVRPQPPTTRTAVRRWPTRPTREAGC